MLSKSAAKAFFLVGTAVCGGSFVLLTVDSIRRIPAQTNEQNLSPTVIKGKDLWDSSNCMGCHTLLGEGAYYAPELTKVYERRGPAFIHAMIKNPEAMYPGQRKMQQYNFTDDEIESLVAFFKWIGAMDLNGFPPKPHLIQVAVANPQMAVGSEATIAKASNRPLVFNQLCIACHSLEGQGGAVGPALDGVGGRRDQQYLATWLKDPQAVKAGTLMPKLPLSDSDVQELAAFLSQLK